MKDLSYSYKAIFKIALPLMVSNLFYVMIAVTDITFMGMVDVVSQAAIGFVALFYLIFFMLGFAYTKGAQILIAQKVGEGKEKAVGLIVDNTSIVLIGMALLLFLPLAFELDFILGLTISDDAVREASYQFLKIRKYGFFLSFLGSVLIAYYSGIGKTTILAIAIITMSLSNILLNRLLIFGEFGLPEMGIAGAALASNIAEGLSLLIMIVGVFLTKKRMQHQLFYFKEISTKIIAKISTLSAPLVVQSLVGLGAWMVFFTLIEKIGPEELAVSNVVKQLYTVLGIPTFALASTTNTVIGNIVGQGKKNEVIPLLKRIILISSSMIVLFSLPAFLFPRFFIGIIAEPSIIEQTVLPLYVSLIALQLYSFSTVLFNCIASLGSTLVSMTVEIITIIVYLIYLYIVFYVMEPELGMLWTSELIYWLSIALLSIAYLRYSGWREKG